MTKHKPRRLPGKSGFVLDLRNPTNGKRTVRGLATSDAEEAEQISHDYARLQDRPDLLNNPEQHILELFGFHSKSLELVFDDTHPVMAKIREQQNPRVGLTQADLDEAEQLARRVLREAIPPPTPLLPVEEKPGSPASAFLKALDPEFLNSSAQQHYEKGLAWTHKAIRDNIGRIIPAKVHALQERVIGLEREAHTIRARNSELQDEVVSLRRRANVHVTATLKGAFDTYSASEKFGRLAPPTRHEMRRAFFSLLAALPNSNNFKLADLRASHIQSWLDGLRRSNGNSYSSRTVSKTRQYVSSIVTALYRRYDLSENPVAKLEPGEHARYDRTSILAFERPEHIGEALKLLSEHSPYWASALGVAVLAGPRYSELTWLRTVDVNLDQNLIQIQGLRGDDGKLLRGTKTGRLRRTPIEQTVLRDLLVQHLEQRRMEQQKSEATEAERSPWLFPSTVPPNPYLPRVKSLPGQWSSNRVFVNAWARVIKSIREGIKDQDILQRSYWAFGPREWRHSACTAMGNSGIDAERGSSWVGNSPAVWRAHYCRPATGGTLWPFRW